MHFLDQAKIYIRSGAGGPGAVSFRREKYVQYGGPDGGNGGRGGDVVFEAVAGLNTLIDFRYTQHFKAQRGVQGMGRNRNGAVGNDIVIKVPVGTQVLDDDRETVLADLTEADIQWQMVDTYQAAARMAIKGEVDASFFLAEAYHSLSKLTKSQLKALMESKLADITHVLLTSAKVGADAERVKEALVGLTGTPDGQPVLDELGIAGGFEPMTQEDAEFMIDLMDTLLD